MGQVLFLADLINTIILVVWWESVLFFMILPTFFRWWQSILGKAVASLEILLLIGFTPGAVHRMLGVPITSRFYLWFTVAELSLIAVRLPWLLWVLFRLQTEGMKPWNAVRSWAKGLPAVLAGPWRRAGRRARRW